MERVVGFIRKTARSVVDGIARIAGDQGETLTMFDSLGYFPNLLWPRSFSEKVVRRKLHAPAMWSEFADKVRVRDYVASRIGEGYLNPLHLVTTTPDGLRWILRHSWVGRQIVRRFYSRSYLEVIPISVGFNISQTWARQRTG